MSSLFTAKKILISLLIIVPILYFTFSIIRFGSHSFDCSYPVKHYSIPTELQGAKIILPFDLVSFPYTPKCSYTLSKEKYTLLQPLLNYNGSLNNKNEGSVIVPAYSEEFTIVEYFHVTTGFDQSFTQVILKDSRGSFFAISDSDMSIYPKRLPACDNYPDSKTIETHSAVMSARYLINGKLTGYVSDILSPTADAESQLEHEGRIKMINQRREEIRKVNPCQAFFDKQVEDHFKNI